MEIDPKLTHIFDQGMAATRSIGAGHAVYHTELVNGGLTRDEATLVTCVHLVSQSLSLSVLTALKRFGGSD